MEFMEEKPFDPHAPTIPMARSERGAIVRFFNTHYFDFITHKIARWVIIGCFTAMLGFFIYSATTLSVEDEQVCHTEKYSTIQVCYA